MATPAIARMHLLTAGCDPPLSLQRRYEDTVRPIPRERALWDQHRTSSMGQHRETLSAAGDGPTLAPRSTCVTRAGHGVVYACSALTGPSLASCVHVFSARFQVRIYAEDHGRAYHVLERQAAHYLNYTQRGKFEFGLNANQSQGLGELLMRMGTPVDLNE